MAAMPGWDGRFRRRCWGLPPWAASDGPALTLATPTATLPGMRSGRFRSLVRLLMVSGLVNALPSHAKTDPDILGRIQIDGLAGDFQPDESLFDTSPSGRLHESKEDSQWGAEDDIRQIRLTWDRRYLYLSVEGSLTHGRLIVLIDVEPYEGLVTLNNTNQWRRHVNFTSEFMPDLVISTTPGEAASRVYAHLDGSSAQLVQLQRNAWFFSESSFQAGVEEPVSELLIPWGTLFADDARGPVVMRDTLMDGRYQRVAFLPPGVVLKVVGLVTGPETMDSGPDVAPNNILGCPAVAAEVLQVDNWVELAIDVDADRLPDMGVSTTERGVYHDDSVPVMLRSWGAIKRAWK